MQKEKNTPKKSTTIAINIADSTLVEDYCKKYEILKKDFVGLAVRWFMDNDIDIRSEVSFAPVQEHQGQQQGTEVAALCKLMAEFINTTQQHKQLALPTTEQITKETEERVKAEMKLEYLQKELEDIRKELEEKKDELTDTADTLGRRTKLLTKAKDELKRLKKGFFNRPDEDVLKELGII